MNKKRFIEKITCRDCGITFEWEDTLADLGSDSHLFRPESCPECEDAASAAARAAHEAAVAEENARLERKRLEGVLAKIRANVPPRFQATDINHPSFRLKAWQTIKNWRPSAETPWLGLIGSTGACKSRMGYLLAEIIGMEIAASQKSMRAICISSPELKDTVMAQFSKSSGHRDQWDYNPADEARANIAATRECDLLFIDDLGKARPSPAYAEELFAIVNYRYDRNLPMLWTANSPPEEITAGLPPDMAAPLAGRLIECSKLYSFK